MALLWVVLLKTVVPAVVVVVLVAVLVGLVMMELPPSKHLLGFPRGRYEDDRVTPRRSQVKTNRRRCHSTVRVHPVLVIIIINHRHCTVLVNNNNAHVPTIR